MKNEDKLDGDLHIKILGKTSSRLSKLHFSDLIFSIRDCIGLGECLKEEDTTKS